MYSWQPMGCGATDEMSCCLYKRGRRLCVFERWNIGNGRRAASRAAMAGLPACVASSALRSPKTTWTTTTTTPAACSSRFLPGSHALEVDVGNARVVCRKEKIHPKYFKEAEVFCNGEHVMSVGGTQAKYVVDVWSGNHPFYQGNRSALLLDADRVEKFRKRYGGFTNLNEVPILDRGEIIIEKRKKPTGKGKGGKK